MSTNGLPIVGCEHDNAVLLARHDIDGHWACPDCGEDWWD